MFKLVFNARGEEKRVYYVLKDEIWVNSMFMDFTPPNAQVLSSSFQRILESGIFGFWETLFYFFYHSAQLGPLGLPKYSRFWDPFIQDLQEEREMKNVPTFGNSLIKSSFYLYCAGFGLSFILFILELLIQV